MDTTKRQQGNGSELLEVKKSAHVNLEQHKTTWLLIGYILVFGVLFVAFEWTATEKKHTGEIVSAGILLEEEIMVPITMPEKKVVPPPPQAKQITEILEIVDDEAEIEESELASVEETGEVVEIADQLVQQRREAGYTSDRDPMNEGLEELMKQKLLYNQSLIDSIPVGGDVNAFVIQTSSPKSSDMATISFMAFP